MTVQAPIGHITALGENHLSNPAYTPAVLLDAMLDRLGLKNDAALARTLQLPPTVVCKLRRRQANPSDAILVRMHDATGWSIRELREQMGIKSKFATQ